MPVFTRRVSDLGPVSLDAIGHGDIGESPAVVHQDAGQLVEGEVAVQAGEPLVGLAAQVEGGETFGVV